jgi:preprotein translocase subunit SecD
MNKMTIKIVLTVLLVGLSLFFLYPTWDWYRTPQAERDAKVKMKDPIINKILNLGLDLRGGTHLLWSLILQNWKQALT